MSKEPIIILLLSLTIIGAIVGSHIYAANAEVWCAAKGMDVVVGVYAHACVKYL